jgi:uncharacterized membrane protein
MDEQLFISIILSFLPIIELRCGLPVVIDYCLRNGLNIGPYFILVVLINCLAILFVFFFMDFLHIHFMKMKFYKKFMDKYIEKIKKKGQKFEGKEGIFLYLALMLFVAIPLPGTGAWTGALIAWLFGFNRKKSIIWISLGVLCAGLVVLTLYFGVLGLFYKVF